jgi:hypothetical protein
LELLDDDDDDDDDDNHNNNNNNGDNNNNNNNNNKVTKEYNTSITACFRYGLALRPTCFCSKAP